mmetsp:Transcript_27508/g.50761  ORF Transcript_27508/g.50761 Transcript_27508/m.50761 type:complete len:98 (-) Transcript_27508:782-1075(-)
MVSPLSPLAPQWIEGQPWMIRIQGPVWMIWRLEAGLSKVAWVGKVGGKVGGEVGVVKASHFGGGEERREERRKEKKKGKKAAKDQEATNMTGTPTHC